MQDSPLMNKTPKIPKQQSIKETMHGTPPHMNNQALNQAQYNMSYFNHQT